MARARDLDLTDSRVFALLLLAVVLLFWVIDALIDAALWREVSLLPRLFFPSSHEELQLALVVCLVSALLYYCRMVMAGRRTVELALQQALQQAQAERKNSAAIMEAMGDAVSIVDPDFRVLYQNRAHQELLGSHLGKRCYEAYRNSSEVCPDCVVQESFRDGRVHHKQVSFEREGGTLLTEITSSVLYDPEGRVSAGIQLVRDVTQRSIAEAARERQAALLEKLIETIPIPIYYKDAGGRFLGCNAAYASFLQLPKERILKNEVQGSPLATDAEEAARDLELMRTLGTRVYEAALAGPREGARQVILSKGAFTDGSGACAGLVGAVVDITQRKEAEAEILALNRELKRHAAELAAANRDLEAFSYSVSHDLRTPLTRIYGSAQGLLECDCELDQNGVFFATAINDGCRQMQDLIDALLVLSRVSRTELDLEEVDLTSLAWEIALKLRHREPRRAVSFDIADAVRAHGDAALLKVVLENLMDNAWKYTRGREEGRIEFGCHPGVAGEAVYFVRDNGAGFDMARVEELFEPFHRLHAASAFPGTGVGLATVQRIVQRHQGRVWGVGAVGVGATFSFTIGDARPAETVAHAASFVL